MKRLLLGVALAVSMLLVPGVASAHGPHHRGGYCGPNRGYGGYRAGYAYGSYYRPPMAPYYGPALAAPYPAYGMPGYGYYPSSGFNYASPGLSFGVGF